MKNLKISCIYAIYSKFILIHNFKLKGNESEENKNDVHNLTYWDVKRFHGDITNETKYPLM